MLWTSEASLLRRKCKFFISKVSKKWFIVWVVFIDADYIITLTTPYKFLYQQEISSHIIVFCQWFKADLHQNMLNDLSDKYLSWNSFAFGEDAPSIFRENSVAFLESCLSCFSPQLE